MQKASFVWALLLLSVTSTVHSQSFDGLVKDLKPLIGQKVSIRLTKGPPVEGKLTELTPARDGKFDIESVTVSVDKRTRRLKPNMIAEIKVNDQLLAFQFHQPTGRTYLIDLQAARDVADQRLAKLDKSRTLPSTDADFERNNAACKDFARKAMQAFKNDNAVQMEEGDHIFLITDYPAPQRKQLAREIDQFIPKLNQIMGFAADEHVLPHKPIIAAFATRQNLGKFQSDVMNNKNYGTIRAFFQIVEGNVAVTAEDDRSPRHMIWQVAWGLSGAYAYYAYSNLEMPAWFRVGLQQHLSDVLVPKLSNPVTEKQDVLKEFATGSLNGILDAQDLPLNRQLVCKFLVAHIYKLSPTGFIQILNMLKYGNSTEEALQLALAMTPAQFAQSFGQSMGVRNMTP